LETVRASGRPLLVSEDPFPPEGEPGLPAARPAYLPDTWVSLRCDSWRLKSLGFYSFYFLTSICHNRARSCHTERSKKARRAAHTNNPLPTWPESFCGARGYCLAVLGSKASETRRRPIPGPDEPTGNRSCSGRLFRASEPDQSFRAASSRVRRTHFRQPAQFGSSRSAAACADTLVNRVSL